jgi:hypothetical protein
MRFLVLLIVSAVCFDTLWAENLQPVRRRPQSTSESPSEANQADFSNRPNNWASTPDESAWWSPRNYSYFVGYESSSSSLGVLGKNAIAAGYWDRGFGIEFFVGYTKTADTFTQTTTTAENVTATSQTQTTVSSNARFPHTFVVGVNPKWRVYQNQWFQLSAGFIVAVSPPASVTYDTGTRVQTTPSTATPTSYSVSETGLGTVESATSLQLNAGVKLGTEFYVKWFPHLALGFATGIVTTVGGGTTTTTSTRTRSFSVVNAVEQAPTSDSNSTIVAEVPRGMSGTTFGIGGTSFQFTGVFTIRYVW